MTVENCVRLHKSYLAAGRTKDAENMKRHMLSGRKFRGHPYVEELRNPPKQSKGGKASGKKSKG